MISLYLLFCLVNPYIVIIFGFFNFSVLNKKSLSAPSVYPAVMYVPYPNREPKCLRGVPFLEQQLDDSSSCPNLSPVPFVVRVTIGRIFLSDFKLHKFKNVVCVQPLPQSPVSAASIVSDTTGFS